MNYAKAVIISGNAVWRKTPVEEGRMIDRQVIGFKQNTQLTMTVRPWSKTE